MSELLDEVLEAHGGADHWRSVSSITAQGSIAGLLPKRFAGNKLATFTFEVQTAKQHTCIHDFPQAGQRAVFDQGDVRIETTDGAVVGTRTDARSAFFGASGARRNLHWDSLDVAYFAGYASWNYLNSPWLLAREGVEVHEGGPWQENGESWRRLEVRFPPDFHTHCVAQTLYVDATGLIRRHDFTAEPVGRWAAAALYCDQHREVDGLTFPTHRRVLPRGLGRVLPRPVLLDLRFDEIRVVRSEP
jgi:hypothetical protein